MQSSALHAAGSATAAPPPNRSRPLDWGLHAVLSALLAPKAKPGEPASGQSEGMGDNPHVPGSEAGRDDPAEHAQQQQRDGESVLHRLASERGISLQPGVFQVDALSLCFGLMLGDLLLRRSVGVGNVLGNAGKKDEGVLPAAVSGGNGVHGVGHDRPQVKCDAPTVSDHNTTQDRSRTLLDLGENDLLTVQAAYYECVSLNLTDTAGALPDSYIEVPSQHIRALIIALQRAEFYSHFDTPAVPS